MHTPTASHSTAGGQDPPPSILNMADFWTSQESGLTAPMKAAGQAWLASLPGRIVPGNDNALRVRDMCRQLTISTIVGPAASCARAPWTQKGWPPFLDQAWERVIACLHDYFLHPSEEVSTRCPGGRIAERAAAWHLAISIIMECRKHAAACDIMVVAMINSSPPSSKRRCLLFLSRQLLTQTSIPLPYMGCYCSAGNGCMPFPSLNHPAPK